MASQLSRLALISNPRSHRNLTGAQHLRDLAQSPFIKGFAEPQTQAQLLVALREFKRTRIDMIALNGGDGTIRDVLTALRQIDPAWSPALLIIPGGKTNLIASDVGAASWGVKGLLQILSAMRKGTLGSNRSRRPILEITRKASQEPPICGMFFGTGAFTEATALARTQANKLRLFHSLAVIWTLVAMILRTLQGKTGGGGEIMALSAGDAAPHVGRRLVIVATTLERLILKLNPFWGPRTGAIRYTDIDAPPLRFAAALPALLGGRPKPWMESSGYRSGSTNRMVLKLSAPFIVDGEMFDPGPEAQIELASRRMVDFIRP